MGTLWQDARYGLRMVARSPGFVAVVLLVVGLGIGANTALFSALDQVYLRPLPVRKPHELISVQYLYRMPDGSWETIVPEFSYPVYEDHRDRSGVLSGLAAFTDNESMTLRVGDVMDRIQGMAVSINYFSLLGLRPALGRLFATEQEQADAAYYPVAVISHGLWRRQFGGRADVLGKQIVLDDRALTVVGVAPLGFTGTIVGRAVDVYLPLGTYAAQEGIYGSADNGWLYLLGRLKPGVGREQAQAALRVVAAGRNEAGRDTTRANVLVFDGRRGYVPEEARVATYPLALFLGMAALVLVIACANIANLQLARAATRQKEIAVRQALGAGRGRVLRQLLVESLLLALAGGVCGVLLAACLDRVICTSLTRMIFANGSVELRACLHPGLHPRVLLFALAISLTTGIAFGLAPAQQLVRRSIVPTLKESAGFVDLPTRRWNPHSLLVVSQIAVALVVLVCSGLCLRNLIGLRSVDPGFDPAQVLAVSYEDNWLFNQLGPEHNRFMEDLRERVSGLPGVKSANLSIHIPLAGGGVGMTPVTHLEGFDLPPGRSVVQEFGMVGPGYFQTLSQSLLTGREFTAGDGPEAPKVMVINEVMARRYWPNESPVGKRVTFSRGREKLAEVREVVGVVKAAKVRSILEESEPIAYLPMAQRPSGFPPVLLIRVTGDARSLIPALREEVKALGPPLPCDIRTVAERVSGLLLPQRILTAILNLLGLVGLLLSATGIYAVMAYTVRQRTREIGIRIALGARGQDVIVPVLLRGTLLLIIGLGLGVGLSLAGTRLLASRLGQIREWDKYFLQGITTWDPATYAGTILVIAAVTLIACYLPARRAARVDPMVALRCE
jgi:predicted permease